MQVRIVLGGHLGEKRPGSRYELVDLPQGSRVANVFKRFGLASERVGLILVNGRRGDGFTPLAEGDRVALFPPELSFNTFVSVSFRREDSKDTGSEDLR